MNVFITFDIEVWPVHSGGWPHRPLEPHYACEREIEAYFIGDTPSGSFGLPYQLSTLKKHGIAATFFVEPLFSFALGLGSLTMVVDLIQKAGQRVALHLHPEWLTDRRCKGLPEFRGPLMSQYSVGDQRKLIQVGWDRLREAGANPIPAFRAGSWGADSSTLQALRDVGLTADSSLNARFEHSMPLLKERTTIQDPRVFDGVVEVPVTRFEDFLTKGGRPLSVIGTSAAEMQSAIVKCERSGRQAVTIVLHGNEFVRTELLWKGQRPLPRRLSRHRFERLCGFLGANSDRLLTRALTDVTALPDENSATELPRSTAWATTGRLVGQLISRWY